MTSIILQVLALVPDPVGSWLVVGYGVFVVYPRDLLRSAAERLYAWLVRLYAWLVGPLPDTPSPDPYQVGPWRLGYGTSVRRWGDGRPAVGFERDGDVWVVFDASLCEIARCPTPAKARATADAYVATLIRRARDARRSR